MGGIKMLGKRVLVLNGSLKGRFATVDSVNQNELIISDGPEWCRIWIEDVMPVDNETEKGE